MSLFGQKLSNCPLLMPGQRGTFRPVLIGPNELNNKSTEQVFYEFMSADVGPTSGHEVIRVTEACNAFILGSKRLFLERARGLNPPADRSAGSLHFLPCTVTDSKVK